jgi:predicted DNA-binding transcriptional regulator AlpA
MFPHEYDKPRNAPNKRTGVAPLAETAGKTAPRSRMAILTSETAAAFELLTEAEAAERLRVSQRHLQRLVELGEGPPRTRLGDRRIAYPLDGLTAWVRHRTNAL